MTLQEAEIEARKVVNRWTMGAAAIGWIPGSSLILSYNQYEMCQAVAKAFDVQENHVEATFAGIAGGIVGRTAADVLLSVIPVVGWAVKSGVAAATTRAIGEGIIGHYRKLSKLPSAGADIAIAQAPQPALPDYSDDRTYRALAPTMVDDEIVALPVAEPTPATGQSAALDPATRRFQAKPRMTVFKRSGNDVRKFAEVQLGARDRGSFAAISGATAPLDQIEYVWDDQTQSLVLLVGADDEIRLRIEGMGPPQRIPRARSDTAAAVPVGPADTMYVANWVFSFR